MSLLARCAQTAQFTASVNTMYTVYIQNHRDSFSIRWLIPKSVCPYLNIPGQSIVACKKPRKDNLSTSGCGHQNEAYLADAIAALIGSMLGVSTVATFAESTAGVADGAKTGGSELAWVVGCSFVGNIESLP